VISHSYAFLPLISLELSVFKIHKILLFFSNKIHKICFVITSKVFKFAPFRILVKQKKGEHPSSSSSSQPWVNFPLWSWSMVLDYTTKFWPNIAKEVRSYRCSIIHVFLGFLPIKFFEIWPSRNKLLLSKILKCYFHIYCER
jgi:hypothetical protein